MPAAPSRVVSEVLERDALSLAEAAALVPSFRPGRATHPATIARWIADGVPLPDGSRLHLEACRVGGRLVTTKAALARFITAQNAATPVVNVLDQLADSEDPLVSQWGAALLQGDSQGGGTK
jgi:hypothetical protein